MLSVTDAVAGAGIGHKKARAVARAVTTGRCAFNPSAGVVVRCTEGRAGRVCCVCLFFRPVRLPANLYHGCNGGRYIELTCAHQDRCQRLRQTLCERPVLLFVVVSIRGIGQVGAWHQSCLITLKNPRGSRDSVRVNIVSLVICTGVFRCKTLVVIDRAATGRVLNRLLMPPLVAR